MPTATRNDLDHLRDAVFFDGPDRGARLSRFWILLVLAAVIASAGVVGDSTATVIGAMIVAPLMTPILGTMLGVVLGDRANLLRCLALVVGGAAAAVAVGYLIGLGVVGDVVAETNAQVAGRVNPRLIDLIAALATGVVGSVALVRRDISDTLPGVAIAISLVPPLTVVGLTLEAGEGSQALGALLLFTVNVAAILATGTAVMAAYGVHRLVTPAADPARRSVNRRNAVLLIVALVVAVGVPLVATSTRIAQDSVREAHVRTAAESFGDATGWAVTSIVTRDGTVIVDMEGPLPVPDTDELRAALEDEGVDPSEVRVELAPVEIVDFGEPDTSAG